MTTLLNNALPQEEYAQFVASLYSDKKTMIVGTGASIFAAFLTYYRLQDPFILGFIAAFAIIGALRFVSMAYFSKHTKGGEIGNVRTWGNVAIAGGVSMGLNLGVWTFYICLFSNDNFAELVAISACLTNMVGVAARNFGMDKLVTYQSAAIGIPVVSGLLLKGDYWHVALALLFIPFFASIRALAASVRELFINTVRTSAELQFMAKYDPLTELLNRASFNQIVNSQLSTGVESYLIAIFDVDEFKSINDRFGHLAGDHLLIELSRRLKNALGAQHVVSRFGGDEFVVFVSGGISEEDQSALHQRISSCFDESFLLLQNTIHINSSVGIAAHHANDSEELEKVIMKADLALYEAKQSGKGRMCAFEEDMDSRFRRREQLKQDLFSAIEKKQLYLHFQPIVNLNTKKVSNCEALLRWDHPEYGTISPGEFIELAEMSGSISALSRFALQEAIRQASTWPEDVSVSVNLSAHDLENDLIVNDIQNYLVRQNLAPSRLVLEITESAILSNPVTATEILFRLRKAGIKTALDDFGTGYANFSYLVDIPFDKLKIDRSVTLRIMEEPRSGILLSGLSEMANRLDMIITVEGVETQEQLEAVSTSGNIDEIQGWIFGRPIPAKDISELLAAQHSQSALSLAATSVA